MGEPLTKETVVRTMEAVLDRWFEGKAADMIRATWGRQIGELVERVARIEGCDPEGLVASVRDLETRVRLLEGLAANERIAARVRDHILPAPAARLRECFLLAEDLIKSHGAAIEKDRSFPRLVRQAEGLLHLLRSRIPTDSSQGPGSEDGEGDS